MKKLFTITLLLLATANLLFAQNIFPSTGNAGIGTATPAFNLDITSTTATTLQIGTTTSTGNPNLIFKGSLGYWKISKTASAGGPSAPSQLDFFYNNGIYGGDRSIVSMIYNGSGGNSISTGSVNTSDVFAGRVIIGTGITSYPAAYTLFVSGGILTEKIKAALKSSSNWSDYVFEKEYQLRSLTDVETFINKNKHLPGVPSGDELIKEGGIDMNQMFAKQMDKPQNFNWLMLMGDYKV